MAGGRDLVVLALDLDAAPLPRPAHLGAQVLLAVDRGDREVALLVARLVAQVGPLRGLLAVPVRLVGAARLPLALARLDLVVPVVRAGVVADAVEDEELGLGPEVRDVADAALLQILLGLLRDEARIAR